MTKGPQVTFSRHDHEKYEVTPLYLAVAGYLSYFILFLVGYVREFLWGIGPLGELKQPNLSFHRFRASESAKSHF